MAIVAKIVGAAVATLAATTLSLVAAAPAHADPEMCVQFLNRIGFVGDYVTSACNEAPTDPDKAEMTLIEHGVPSELAAMAVQMAVG